MWLLMFTIALVALTAVTFLVAGVSVNAACVVGGAGFALLIAWAVLS